MDHHAPVEVDPASLHAAQKTWNGFTTMIKINLAAIIALLVAMAVFLV